MKHKNLIISIISGIGIIVSVYFLLKYFKHYNNSFELFNTFNNKLLGISIIGSWISLFLWRIDFFKYVLVSMGVVFLGFLFTYNLGKVDKTIYLENFSNVPQAIIINGKKYKVNPHFSKKLEFPKINVKIEGESIQKGCYIVNLSYPNKFYQLSLVQSINFNGVKFNIANKLINKITKKIFRVDESPNCWVSLDKSFFAEDGNVYYIKEIKK